MFPGVDMLSLYVLMSILVLALVYMALVLSKPIE
jgi:hypothetical protein